MPDTWHTETEIGAQPKIWRDWAAALPGVVSETREWISQRAPDEIWLCGAGTSAFIGDTLAVGVSGALNKIPVRAIASTDLVARPQDYLMNGTHPLVISFGRSGNSSESIGTLDILDRLAPQADRLHITCNKDSALAQRPSGGPGETRVIVLPDACHDKGFAMTSSYTTMLLTALAILDGGKPKEAAVKLHRLADAAELLLAALPDMARPTRAVFLGSGPFLGTARESALKVLELTAGEVVTAWDSTLGFRHGPKAVVNSETSVFIYLSSDPLTRRYDQDIATEIRQQFPQARVVSIGEPVDNTDAPDIPVRGCGKDIWNAALFVLVAQRLSVIWSKSLDLDVDNPFSSGNLTRVVSNVRLYS